MFFNCLSIFFQWQSIFYYWQPIFLYCLSIFFIVLMINILHYWARFFIELWRFKINGLDISFEVKISFDFMLIDLFSKCEFLLNFALAFMCKSWCLGLKFKGCLWNFFTLAFLWVFCPFKTFAFALISVLLQNDKIFHHSFKKHLYSFFFERKRRRKNSL